MADTTPPEAATLIAVAQVAAGLWRKGPAPLPQGAAVRLVLEVLALGAAAGHAHTRQAEHALLSGGPPDERHRIACGLCAAIGSQRLAQVLRAAGIDPTATH